MKKQAKKKVAKKVETNPYPNLSAARKRALDRMSMEEIEMGLLCGDLGEEERNYVLGM